jgi:hypothetical protein
MTITSAPTPYNSAHGDVIYTVSETAHTSDPTTYPNYKFVGDVYIGATLVARIKKVPDPVTGIGIFNIGQIIRNYLSAAFNPDPSNILAQRMGNGEFSIQVTMKFGEEYSFTLFTNILVDDPREFFNSYNGRLNGADSDLLPTRFVSDRPTTSPVRCDSTFNLIPYLPSSITPIDITISSYDYGDSFVNSFVYTFTPVLYELAILNFAESVINNESTGFINDTIKYYTANIGAFTYRFDIDCECTYDTYTLHFLNKYGGFESKDFTKVSRKTISIEKKDFGKLPYTVDGSGVVSYKSSNNVYNESRSVYSSLFKEKMSLNSDLLTDAEYRWLQQLVVSPMVYIQDSGFFYPVVISENNYEPKMYVNDELTNLTLNIEYGVTENAQFR